MYFVLRAVPQSWNLAIPATSLSYRISRPGLFHSRHFLFLLLLSSYKPFFAKYGQSFSSAGVCDCSPTRSVSDSLDDNLYAYLAFLSPFLRFLKTSLTEVVPFV